MRALLAFAPILLVGCDRTHQYFPLEAGRAASYRIRREMTSHVEELRVDRQISVGGETGAIIASPMGECRVAWKNGMLLASKLANSEFAPALPLLAPNDIETPIRWQGVVTTLGVSEKANATLLQERSKLLLAGKNLPTIKTTITLDTPRRQIQLVSDYSASNGLLRQTHHTNGAFDESIELLVGPN